MKPITGAATVALVLALSACSGSSDAAAYPVNAQTNFLNSCEHNSGSPARCQCFLDWFQRHISFTAFQADEDQVTNGSVPEDVKVASKHCP